MAAGHDRNAESEPPRRQGRQEKSGRGKPMSFRSFPYPWGPWRLGGSLLHLSVSLDSGFSSWKIEPIFTEISPGMGNCAVVTVVPTPSRPSSFWHATETGRVRSG